MFAQVLDIFAFGLTAAFQPTEYVAAAGNVYLGQQGGWQGPSSCWLLTWSAGDIMLLEC